MGSIAAKLARIDAKKAKRLEKAAENAALKGETALAKAPPRGFKATKARKPAKRSRKIKRGPLKSRIVRLLGLLDKKTHGPLCRLGEHCPKYATSGYHFGTLAYHVTPAQRGDSTRFLPENVVWACSSANCGEYYNRSLYRQKHIDRFGKEYVERIEEMAREIKQYTTAELVEMHDRLKAQVGADS